MAPQQHSPSVWLCLKCDVWNWPKKTHCFQTGCCRPRPAKPILFGQRHSKPTGANTGGGKHQKKADAEIDKRIELLTKQVEKLTAKGNPVGLSSSRSPSAPSAPAPTTEPDLLSELQCIEADQKMVAGRLKERPNCPRMLQWAEELKMSHEGAQKRLHDSKDPDEQIRSKSSRLNRLKDQCEAYVVKLREACTEEEEAGKRADALCEKIRANKAEIE